MIIIHRVRPTSQLYLPVGWLESRHNPSDEFTDLARYKRCGGKCRREHELARSLKSSTSAAPKWQLDPCVLLSDMDCTSSLFISVHGHLYTDYGSPSAFAIIGGSARRTHFLLLLLVYAVLILTSLMLLITRALLGGLISRSLRELQLLLLECIFSGSFCKTHYESGSARVAWGTSLVQ